MAAGVLDERINAFYDGRHDVLLATTIVESGLDIPTANTMIIHRADLFGLSQLYQIRGRVGRAKTRAYCYLTTRPRKPLTNGGILWAALRRPFGARRVWALIHWQAVKLWWKGASFRTRPEPPAQEVSRG